MTRASTASIHSEGALIALLAIVVRPDLHGEDLVAEDILELHAVVRLGIVVAGAPVLEHQGLAGAIRVVGQIAVVVVVGAFGERAAVGVGAAFHHEGITGLGVPRVQGAVSAGGSGADGLLALRALADEPGVGGGARVDGAALGFVVLGRVLGGDLHGLDDFGDGHAVVEVHVGVVEVDGLVAAGWEDHGHAFVDVYPVAGAEAVQAVQEGVLTSALRSSGP